MLVGVVSTYDTHTHNALQRKHTHAHRVTPHPPHVTQVQIICKMGSTVSGEVSGSKLDFHHQGRQAKICTVMK